MNKILFVHYSLVCGGVESALLNLCSMLDKSKYDITVLEYYGWGNKLRPQFDEAGIRVISPYSSLSPGVNIFEKVRNVCKQKYIQIRLDNNKVYIDESYDLIVYFQVTGVRVKCRSNPKIITYIHGDIATNIAYRRSIFEHYKYIVESSRIVCVSELAKESLKKIAGIAENTVVAYNPIDTAHIKDLANEGIVEEINRPYICAVGRLFPEKRFDLLIKIHKNIIDKGILHDLVIVGEGKEREKLEKIIVGMNIEKTVHMVGFKDNPYPYIKNSLFTVCSSETEGLHVVSMESLILGRPVVSSFPTVAELFGKEKCGIVTDVIEENLGKAIAEMLSNEDLYEKSIEAARKRSCYFDSENMVKKIEEIYDDVIRL